MKKLAYIIGFTLVLSYPLAYADDFAPAVQDSVNISGNTSNTLTLDSDNTGGDIILQFGTTLNESLKWNSASTQFDLSDDLSLVGGGLTTSGGANSLNNNSNFATNINTGTSTGAVTIGGGLNTVAIDSTSWDISTAGVASGLTGITSSGTIDFTAGMSASGGTINLNDSSNNNVNINTGTSTGAVAIGNGNAGNTLTIGGGTPILEILVGTCSINPTSIAANNKGTATCTATGVATGQGWDVFMTPPNTLENMLVPQGATISGANTITVSIQNTGSTAAVNGAALTWSWFAIR
jgi:hypothetical protein